MYSNPRIVAFLDGLRDRGVALKVLWSTKRSPKNRYDDVNFVAFSGDGFSPNISTAVIVDYGEDGYGFYPSSNSIEMRADIDLVARRVDNDLTSFDEAKAPADFYAYLVAELRIEKDVATKLARRLYDLKKGSMDMERVRKFAKGYDDEMNDAAHDGEQARPPVGDDYNNLYSELMG